MNSGQLKHHHAISDILETYWRILELLKQTLKPMKRIKSSKIVRICCASKKVVSCWSRRIVKFIEFTPLNESPLFKIVFIEDLVDKELNKVLNVQIWSQRKRWKSGKFFQISKLPNTIFDFVFLCVFFFAVYLVNGVILPMPSV